MEIDPTRMCELLVGLLDVDVVGVDDPLPGHLVVVVSPIDDRPSCWRCGTVAWVEDRREVDLVDLPAFDQTVTLRIVLDDFKPDRYDYLGATICLVGVAVIMFAPRGVA